MHTTGRQFFLFITLCYENVSLRSTYRLGQWMFLNVVSLSNVLFFCHSQDKLGKSVNMRAMNMLGKAEEKVHY